MSHLAPSLHPARFMLLPQHNESSALIFPSGLITVRSRRSLSRDKNDAQIHKIKDGLNDHKQSVGSFYNTYSNQLNSSFA